MQEVGLNQLLEAGVHFGHQTRRWNPKMRKYIFTERNGIHIIDLRKTLDRLQAAQKALHEVVNGGERVLFVCTKAQLRGIIEEEAKRCGAFYVTERWLGGMLTNFQTIRKQIRRLKELERGQEENAFEFYTKKEQLLLDRERQKLDKYLSGVKDMSRLPGAVFVVDAKREIIAVREAHRLEIPVIAITDTNADPDLVDYPIPGNDDAIRSVSLITRAVADVVVEAKRAVSEDDRRLAEQMEATTYSTETGETTDESARTKPRRKKKRKKKRVPRPEVIAQHRKGAADEKGDEPQEEVEEAAAASEDPADAEADAAAPAGEAEEEGATENDVPVAEAEEEDAGEEGMPAAESEKEGSAEEESGGDDEDPRAEAEEEDTEEEAEEAEAAARQD